MQGLVCSEHQPRLILDFILRAPAAVIRCHGVQHLLMNNAFLDGAGGVMIDLTLLFGQWLTLHTDNLGAYHAYVDDAVTEYVNDTAIAPFGNGSDGSEERMECVD